MRNSAGSWPNRQTGLAPALIVAVLVTTGVCAGPIRATPDLARQPFVVHLQPEQPWTDTGITVQKGDLLFVKATGQVFWADGGKTTGPDGTDGVPGVFIGTGGLVGRIAGTTKPFDVGGRTRPLMYRHIRMHRYYPPPALRMPASGRLQLGFKDFRAGANRGAYEVTIEPGQLGERSDRP